jgi:LAGLIDADG DNA endonuclease family protein
MYYYKRMYKLPSGTCQNCSKGAKRIIQTPIGVICRPCYYNYKRYGDPNYPSQRSNDDIITPLTDYQKQVFTGCMLGDGWMELGTYGKNPSFRAEHCLKDKEYVQYLYSIFENFCTEKGYSERTRTDNRPGWPKHTYSACFHTRSIPAFVEHYNRWYKNGKKIIPLDLKASELTPAACAVWFADDGCFFIRNEKDNALRINLSTQGFTHKEVLFLESLLIQVIGGEFSIKGAIENGKEQYVIGMKARTASKFIQYIEQEYLKLSMERKSDKWKHINFSIFTNSRFDTKREHDHIKNNILDIGKEFQSFTFADIEDKLNPKIGRRSLKWYLNRLVEEHKLSKIKGSYNSANIFSVLKPHKIEEA